MKTLLKLVSFVGLALTILPAVFVFVGALPVERHYLLAAVGMALWFGSAVLWIKPEKTDS